ncbi:hypothetical protein [Lentzea sp.]|uniref:hypothetical protein n=1 Tax=Lentzea sp. TaxID=56099 RepID=UPI002ED489F2
MLEVAVVVDLHEPVVDGAVRALDVRGHVLPPGVTGAGQHEQQGQGPEHATSLAGPAAVAPTFAHPGHRKPRGHD